MRKNKSTFPGLMYNIDQGFIDPKAYGIYNMHSSVVKGNILFYC